MPGPGENDDSDAGEPASPERDSTRDESPLPETAPDFSDEDAPNRSSEETPDGHTSDDRSTGDQIGNSPGETAGRHDADDEFPRKGERSAFDRSTGTRAPDQSTTGGASENRSAGGPQAGQREYSNRRPGTEAEEDEVRNWVLFSRDILITVLAVVLIGGYLFAISGVWPPMVAIESGSMEPNMNINDMVFVMDNDRFEPAAAHGETGVVTAHSGAAVGYTQYGNSGDVIIFEPGGDEDATPIIHRAMFWVEDGENWYDRANESYIGTADSCAELSACPAPNAGFITKGDANSGYDQASLGGSNDPVKPDWIVGTAEIRIPRLGWFRLQL